MVEDKPQEGRGQAAADIKRWRGRRVSQLVENKPQLVWEGDPHCKWLKLNRSWYWGGERRGCVNQNRYGKKKRGAIASG